MFISRLDLIACSAAASKPSNDRGFAGSIMKTDYLKIHIYDLGGWVGKLIRTKHLTLYRNCPPYLN